MIRIEAIVKLEFRPGNEEWEGILTPTLIQTYPRFYTCEDCAKDIHVLELTGRMPDATQGRCPQCNNPVTPKEDDVRQLQQTEYSAPSVCEVNSAVETNLLMLQREVEQAERDLEAAENKQVNIKRVGEDETDAEQSADQG